MSVTYIEADEAIASGNIDTIRELTSRNPRTMIKSLLYSGNENMAIAAIREFGPSSSDGYSARKLSNEGLMKVIDQLSFDEVIRGCVYAVDDKSRAIFVYNYYKSQGRDVFGELVTNINNHRSSDVKKLIGKFAAIVHDPLEVVMIPDSRRLITFMMPFLSETERDRMMVTTIKYRDIECFRGTASDRLIPIKTMISSVFRVGDEAFFGALCHYYGGDTVMRSVTSEDLDSLARCGGIEIIRSLGIGVTRHRSNSSSMVYHAAYNNHPATVEWVLDIFPDMIIKAVDSAVKGMAKDVLERLISRDPVSTMPRIPDSILDYLLKNMSQR